MADEFKERVIAEEYRVWKKNAPYLYDCVITHALEWPSLTVEWLPGKSSVEGQDYDEHKMILGTHTSGAESNYLMIATVRLPSEDAVIDARRYDEERGELGGYGGLVGKVEFSVKMLHPGEVNRARACPQNSFHIATKTPSGEVLIYDYSMHPSVPAEDSLEANPQLRLKGHVQEGYGLSWNSRREGKIASGADDRMVCVWDTKGHTGTGAELDPIQILRGHTDVVEDVTWHPFHDEVLASVGDDKRLLLWDLRSGSSPTKECVANDGNVNCCAFNPFMEVMIATGGKGGAVRLWDLRNMSAPLHSLSAHNDEVFQVRWAPFRDSVLASAGGSEDRRIALWDLARIGAEQTPEDAEDGPPELLFLHGGHTSTVSDLAFNNSDDWFVASVAADNIVQIWQPAGNIYAAKDDDALPAGAKATEDAKGAAVGAKAVQEATRSRRGDKK